MKYKIIEEITKNFKALITNCITQIHTPQSFIKEF